MATILSANSFAVCACRVVLAKNKKSKTIIFLMCCVAAQN
jgi:hypothetical protein